MVGAILSSGGIPVDTRLIVAAAGTVAGWLTEPFSPAGTPEPVESVGPFQPPPTRTPAPVVSHPTPAPRADDDYLLMSRSELRSLPTSGPAWEALLAIADGPLGRPDLTDQNTRHGINTLAVALVAARTDDRAYRDRARAEILAAIGTEQERAGNSILSLGRQLGAYVLAADFIKLSGGDDERFRDWLADIRTRVLGGHGRWRELTATHEDSANNWGAFAGASRIAASLYLGDTADVERAAQVLRGFLGERSAWSDFQPVAESMDWACVPERYTPVNPPCVRSGIELDGTIVRDISRGGSLRWPQGASGISYTLESLQGLILQAELLYQNGHDDPWRWSDAAIHRIADVVTASGAIGGDTWNRSPPSFHLPWILNARYGLDLPTEPAGAGRVFGYTDWLYGD
ncbi:hypothetical protein BH20CHL7_BH20CHL7_03490 [soil metagenome]